MSYSLCFNKIISFSIFGYNSKRALSSQENPSAQKEVEATKSQLLEPFPEEMMNNDAAPVRTSPSAGTDAMGDPLAKAKSSLVETGAVTDPHPKAKKVSFAERNKSQRFQTKR